MKKYHPKSLSNMVGFALWIFGIAAKGNLCIGLIALIFVFSSCEEKTDWELSAQATKTIVVEGIITNEFKIQQVRLSRPFSDPNGSTVSVSGAQVTIRVENTTIAFAESPEFPGYYFTLQPAAAVIDKTYTLTVQTESTLYQASAAMIPVLPYNQPAWVKNPESGLYKIEWNNSAYSPSEQAMFEAVISWEHLVPTGFTDTLATARLMHYTLNTLDVNYVIFPPDKKEVWFPQGSVVIVKKYSVNDEFGAYLRALLAETEWQGSLFEEARGNLPTNISNCGLGFFSACSVISDTLLVY